MQCLCSGVMTTLAYNFQELTARELRPGLFLGQAYVKTKKREILMLYFGLEKRPTSA